MNYHHLAGRVALIIGLFPGYVIVFYSRNVFPSYRNEHIKDFCHERVLCTEHAMLTLPGHPVALSAFYSTYFVLLSVESLHVLYQCLLYLVFFEKVVMKF